MWDFLCEHNLNMLLIAAGILVADIIAVAVLWAPINKLHDRIERVTDRWIRPEPDCTVTETGVGEIVPWQITQERDEWEELAKIFSDQ